jgi:hypothetical protein
MHLRIETEESLRFINQKEFNTTHVTDLNPWPAFVVAAGSPLASFHLTRIIQIKTGLRKITRRII